MKEVISMWFFYSVLALLCWSGSDLFSKIGCIKQNDKYSPLKMVTAVGTVMGIHALYGIFFEDIEINFSIILNYLPVSLLYILSMSIGYFGLRYIELSISSPICNSSGALVAVLSFITVGITSGIAEAFSLPAVIAVVLVCVGVIGLGVTEAHEDEDLRKARQDIANQHYTKSKLAIILPVIYCLLDALGTFADSIVLEKLDEDSANTAYELTFLVMGIVAFIYTKFVKKQKYIVKCEAPKFIGAIFETIGQLFYIYALADTAHVAYAAPIISSYCVVSVLWSRIFLKEKLSVKHYLCVLTVVIGIVIMGILDI